jgi:hypothetical protein
VKALGGQGSLDEFTGALIILHHQDRPATEHLRNSLPSASPVDTVARDGSQEECVCAMDDPPGVSLADWSCQASCRSQMGRDFGVTLARI